MLNQPTDPQQEEKPPLVNYMTTDSKHERAAAYLETYAARILDKTETSWEIPNTRASVLKDIAALLRCSEIRSAMVTTCADSPATGTWIGAELRYDPIVLSPVLQQLRDRHEALTAALKVYGRHSQTCACFAGWETPCTCGFKAALAKAGA